MKTLPLITLFLFFCVETSAQEKNVDSLRRIIYQHKGDTSEVNALNYLAFHVKHQDSALVFIQRALELAKKIKYKKGEADGLIIRSIIINLKDLSEAIQEAIDALNIYTKINYTLGMTTAHGALQAWYRDMGDYRNALSHALECLRLAKAHNLTQVTLLMENQGIADRY